MKESLVMKKKEFFKPTKIKIIVFVILSIIGIFFLNNFLDGVCTIGEACLTQEQCDEISDGVNNCIFVGMAKALIPLLVLIYLMICLVLYLKGKNK